MTFLGLLLSYLIGLKALIFATLVWVVGVLYNWRLKRTGLLGNLMVSLSVGMTFIFGALTVGRPLEELVWFFTITAMLIDLGEEIGVDALDAEGDRELGSQSLALKLGRKSALSISGALFLTVVLWSGVPFLLGWLSWPYLLPLGLMDGVILYALAQVMVFETPSPRKYLRWIYLSGLAAMLIFLVMRLLG